MKFSKILYSLFLLSIVFSSHILTVANEIKFNKISYNKRNKRIKSNKNSNYFKKFTLKKVNHKNTHKNTFKLYDLDPETCIPKPDSKEKKDLEDKNNNFDFGLFVVNAFISWDIPIFSKLVSDTKKLTELMNEKCIGRIFNINLLFENYKKLISCFENQEANERQELQSYLMDFISGYLNTNQINEIIYLSPKEACEKSQEYFNDLLHNLKINKIPLTMGISYGEKFLEKNDSFSKLLSKNKDAGYNALEHYINKTKEMYRKYQENLDLNNQEHFTTVLKLAVGQIKKDLKEMNKKIEDLDQVIKTNCSKLESFESDSNAKSTNLSFVVKSKAFFRAFDIWTDECNILEKLFSIKVDFNLRYLFENGLKIVLMILGGILVKVYSMYKKIIKLFETIKKAYLKWNQNRRESSGLLGTAIGIVLNIISTYFGLFVDIPTTNFSVSTMMVNALKKLKVQKK